MTAQQRQMIDDVVLVVIREAGSLGLRKGEILIDERVQRAIAAIPGNKPDHRYVSEAFQRIRADKIELVRLRWRTVSPTA